MSIEMSTDKEIGERLRLARISKNYKSAAEAARAIGSPYPTYAGHENGNRGLRANLERYGRFFGVDADWLLTGKGTGPANPADTRAQKIMAAKKALLDLDLEGQTEVLAYAAGLADAAKKK